MNVQRYTCNCGFEVDYYSQLINHVQANVFGAICHVVYTCKCSKRFKSFKLLNRHVKAEERCFNCGLCVKEFKYHAHRVRHWRSIHKSDYERKSNEDVTQQL